MTIRRPPQLVDSDRPLYFTIHGNMFLVTDSMKLDETLKRVFVVQKYDKVEEH